jgi:putative protease
MNLSPYLGEMLDAGVTSFKIEGRLKDVTYVANVVSAYRARLDAALAERGLRKSSSGKSDPGFEPNLGKTFNRGYTTYFLHGRSERIGSPDTPKMVGEVLGRVVRADAYGVVLDGTAELHPGDGLCFFDREGKLDGTVVNTVEGHSFVPDKPEKLRVGMYVFRNHDHEFLEGVRKARHERRIGVELRAVANCEGVTLEAVDENGVRFEASLKGPFDVAKKPEVALESIQRQLAKTGDTHYSCTSAVVEAEPVPFVTLSALNALRRDLLTGLTEAREAVRPRETGAITPNDTPYPETELSYLGNVLNEHAKNFYRRHGVQHIESGAETGVNLRERKVMTTRYCIKEQFGMCPRHGGRPGLDEPLALINQEGHRLELRFNCARCEMEIYLAH